MRKLQEDAVREFMRSGSRTGKLATVRADGSPHIAAIWFDFDPGTGDLMFITETTSLKYKNLQRDPRVSILTDDEAFPYGWARVDGVATASTENLIHWATECCRRYVGDERAEQYGRRNGVAGEVVVRVALTRLAGMSHIAS